jgi:hypothetical protein
MKFLILLLFPVLSFAQFYHFEKGEQFTIKESRWARLSNANGDRLKPSCQLLGISKIEVVEQFKENILFKVLANRGLKSPACAPGTLIHTNDVMADTLRGNSKRYWLRKNKIKKILKGDHTHTTLNGIHLGDRFYLNYWEWASVEETVYVNGERFWETRLCRLLPRGAMKVIGLLAQEEQVLLEYDMPYTHGYSECPNKIIFAKPLKRF